MYGLYLKTIFPWAAQNNHSNMQQKGGIQPRTAAKDSALCALKETL